MGGVSTENNSPEKGAGNSAPTTVPVPPAGDTQFAATVKKKVAVVKPKPAPAAKTAATPAAAPAQAPAKIPDNPTPAAPEKKGLLDNALSVFGWN